MAAFKDLVPFNKVVNKFKVQIVNYALPSSAPGRTISFSMISPESVSETPSTPNFDTYDIPGRSSPPVSYSGGEQRTLSFTLSLHRDLLDVNSNYMMNADSSITAGYSSEKALSDNFAALINQLKALNYPRYSSAGLIPPTVYCKIGNDLRIRGYCSVTFDYKRPIDKYGRFMAVDVTFDFTEVLDVSWSADEIINGMKRYVTYYDKDLR